MPSKRTVEAMARLIMENVGRVLAVSCASWTPRLVNHVDDMSGLHDALVGMAKFATVLLLPVEEFSR